MQMCKELPELKLNVKEDHKDVLRLIEIIKPSWKKEEVNIKLLSGGYSCIMLRCSDASGESVTVRVRNLSEPTVNPAHEKIVAKVMSAKGYFPPLLAMFQNGFCYEYIPGRPFVTMEATHFSIDENQTRLVAEQMANIHQVIVPEFDYTKTTYFDFYFDLLSTSKPWFKECPPIEELNDELQFVKEFVSSVGSPQVLIHGDPHPANLIWNENENKMTFVDWELTKIAPRGCDMAYFINSAEAFGEACNAEVSIPDDFHRKFCESYLQRVHEQHGKPPPTKEEIDKLVLELKHYLLMVKLSIVVYYVKFEDLMKNFESTKRMTESVWSLYIGKYLQAKEELLGIKGLGRKKED